MDWKNATEFSSQVTEYLQLQKEIDTASYEICHAVGGHLVCIDEPGEDDEAT
jgi:hypothetical protein